MKNNPTHRNILSGEKVEKLSSSRKGYTSVKLANGSIQEVRTDIFNNIYKPTK